MKKRKLKISIIIVTPLVVCLFWLWYGQTHTGSRSGQVFDVNTGKPIEGAVVDYFWVFSPVMGSDRHAANFETTTDKDGKYFIPSQRVVCPNPLLYGPLQPEKVIIYKDGFAVYVADLSLIKSPIIKPIGYPNDNQTYHKKNNIVKLYPWKEGESHDRHIHWIDTESHGGGELLNKELELEKKRAYQENEAKWRRK